MSKKSLIVVESPSKAKTIEKYLDNKYDVIACVGHVKDLPSSNLGIDIDNDFEMTLNVLPNRKDFIKELKKRSESANRVYIASDPDREGEAIAAHLASEVPKNKLERVEFTEITKAGIKDGMNKSRKLNENLINAQKTRRIIDRLVGYKVSPVLWATLQKNMNFVNTTLSAGRVQSACVKILIERDRKRQKYLKTEYFDLNVELKNNESNIKFKATLNKVGEKNIVSSHDFDSSTGQLKNNNSLILDEKEAKKLAAKLKKGKWIVKNIKEKPRTSNPKPPFTTSTLQQEAARKLRFSAKNTMRVAQQLYENGFITYMRTDSTHLSKEAVKGSRDIISKLFGDEFLPQSVNQYETNVKNAQEAHEAIRPAHKKFLTVEEVNANLGQEASKLYELIWQRTIASQMLPAKLKQTSVVVSNQETEFKANGQIITFPGYMKIYVEGRDNPEAELANKEKILPELKIKEELSSSNLLAQSHSTKPPARFTEASLVKEMESNGIGRPSTFASALDTIVRRGYAQKIKNNLLPTYLGLAVTQLLENHFSNLVDKEFTATMENGLDAISRGELNALPFIKDFYFGAKNSSGLEIMLKEKVDISKACTIPLPDSLNSDIDARIGRYGPYLKKDDDTRSIPEDIFVGDLTSDVINSLFKEDRKDESLGYDKETGESILLKKGPYGYYVQIGETTKRKAIPKDIPLELVDLNLANSLLSLPRLIGVHPETNAQIMADYGRYGPYLKMEKSNARLIGEITPLNVTVEQAIDILSKSKKGSSEIKTLGTHPDTGEELILKEGRYGPYISDGKLNAALKSEHSSETITLEEAIILINIKRSSPKRPRKKRRKKK
tara:strand:- start:3435 stop:5951 length:2517 start_codon:yes stop_codon:yes gene_type:complete